MAETEALLLDAAAVALLLSVSPRTLRALRSAGKLPQPVALLRRSPRWRRSDLVKWTERGCPGGWESR